MSAAPPRSAGGVARARSEAARSRAPGPERPPSRPLPEGAPHDFGYMPFPSLTWRHCRGPQPSVVEVRAPWSATERCLAYRLAAIVIWASDSPPQPAAVALTRLEGDNGGPDTPQLGRRRYARRSLSRWRSFRYSPMATCNWHGRCAVRRLEQAPAPTWRPLAARAVGALTPHPGPPPHHDRRPGRSGPAERGPGPASRPACPDGAAWRAG